MNIFDVTMDLIKIRAELVIILDKRNIVYMIYLLFRYTKMQSGKY